MVREFWVQWQQLSISAAAEQCLDLALDLAAVCGCLSQSQGSPRCSAKFGLLPVLPCRHQAAESSVKIWSTRMESSSGQVKVVHYLHVVVANYTESCPETLCSRNALQQQLAFMHNRGQGTLVRRP